MKALLTILLSTALILLSYCCKPKSPCDSITCKKLQECVDGSCICLGSGYNMGKWCYPKDLANQYLFYNVSQCYGFDTLVLSVSREPLRSSKPAPSYVIAITTPKYEYPLFTTFTVDDTDAYVKESTGDSFFVNHMEGMATTIKGKWCNAVDLYGKMNVNKDTLKLKIVWRTGDTLTNRFVAVDSCYKVFTK